MSTKAGSFISVSLLLLAGHAAAQNYTAPAPVETDKVELPGEVRRPAWTSITLYGQDASFRFTHNNDDGMVVGMGLRRDQYSVQFELAPPVPMNNTETERVLMPIPPEAPKLRTVHKLSLRYRF
jgi:hypothetical protein